MSYSSNNLLNVWFQPKPFLTRCDVLQLIPLSEDSSCRCESRVWRPPATPIMARHYLLQLVASKASPSAVWCLRGHFVEPLSRPVCSSCDQSEELKEIKIKMQTGDRQWLVMHQTILCTLSQWCFDEMLWLITPVGKDLIVTFQSDQFQEFKKPDASNVEQKKRDCGIHFNPIQAIQTYSPRSSSSLVLWIIKINFALTPSPFWPRNKQIQKVF